MPASALVRHNPEQQISGGEGTRAWRCVDCRLAFFCAGGGGGGLPLGVVRALAEGVHLPDDVQAHRSAVTWAKTRQGTQMRSAVRCFYFLRVSMVLPAKVCVCWKGHTMYTDVQL